MFEKAERHYQEAGEIQKSIEDPLDEGNRLSALGELAMGRGAFGEATDAFQNALSSIARSVIGWGKRMPSTRSET